MQRPLEGITVVALEQVIAGPFATRQLAELGARVIKIERPGGGDAARGYDRTVKGLSSHRSEEHTSELQSRLHLVCRLLLEKKKKKHSKSDYTNCNQRLYRVTT